VAEYIVKNRLVFIIALFLFFGSIKFIYVTDFTFFVFHLKNMKLQNIVILLCKVFMDY